MARRTAEPPAEETTATSYSGMPGTQPDPDAPVIEDDAYAEESDAAKAARLGARADELAKMSTERLVVDADDRELEAELTRLAKLGRRPTRGIVSTPRAQGKARLDASRQSIPATLDAARWRIWQECSRPQGPSLESLSTVATLETLASVPAGFWQRLEDLIDGPNPPHSPELYTADDPAAEVRQENRDREARMQAIHAELEGRAVYSRIQSQPGIAETITRRMMAGGR